MSSSSCEGSVEGGNDGNGGEVGNSGDADRKEWEWEGVGARKDSRSVSEPDRVSARRRSDADIDAVREWCDVDVKEDVDADASGLQPGERDKRDEPEGEGVLSREKEVSLSMAMRFRCARLLTRCNVPKASPVIFDGCLRSSLAVLSSSLSSSSSERVNLSL